MSVWSTAVQATLPLLGTEGALVSVSISVEPPRLEALLDALAHLDFPINPQIYHDAGPATLVDFPAYEKRLPEIRGLLEKRRAVLENVDASVIAEAPKIAPHLEKMKAKLGAALGIPPARVNLKATTNEKLGFAGRGEGIAAMAVACVTLPD